MLVLYKAVMSGCPRVTGLKKFHPCWSVLLFIFRHLLTFIRYIEVYFTFGLLDCVRYKEDFVKSRFVISRFCSIHFTVIFAGLKRTRSLYRGLR